VNIYLTQSIFFNNSTYETVISFNFTSLRRKEIPSPSSVIKCRIAAVHSLIKY